VQFSWERAAAGLAGLGFCDSQEERIMTNVAATYADKGTAAAVGTQVASGAKSRLWVGLIGGFVLGLVAMGLAVWMLMPGMMIVTKSSKLGFDETVATLQATLDAEGWSSPMTLDLNKSMAKHGEVLEPRVKIIQLCKAPYAKQVLTTDRHVSCLMPCSIAVWEDDAGQVHVSKMNTGLMGKMFGGTIAEVMGGKVAAEEARMLATVTDH
jgi:uncharacterized protein (DUF302 family)